MREMEEGTRMIEGRDPFTLKLYIVNFTLNAFMGELEFVLGESYLLRSDRCRGICCYILFRLLYCCLSSGNKYHPDIGSGPGRRRFHQ